MAKDGNFSRTLECGSEALFDHECTQCRMHGSKEEATNFCQECKEFLCQICGRYHIRNLKTHTLVSVASMTLSRTVVTTTGPVPAVAKCQYHPDRELDMYCGTHDMVYCNLCIAKDHRSCRDVQEITEVAHKSHVSKLETIVADITLVNKRLHDTKLEKSNDIKLIKKQKAGLLQEINAERKRMNKQLDELEKKMITDLDAELNKLEKEINADIKVADELVAACDSRKPDWTSDYDEKQMFIIAKLAHAALAEAYTFLNTAHLLKHPTLLLEENEALCGVIARADRMGKFTRNYCKSKRSTYNLKYISKINIRVDSDKHGCFINDMCQLPDGSILLIDNVNNKLKKLNDQLNVKDFLDLEAKPQALCFVPPCEVAVQLNNKTLHFINVGKTLSHQRKVSVNHSDNEKNGMVYCNNQLWIPGDKAVHVYSQSGTLVKTIEIDSEGQKIFPEDDPKNISVSEDGTKVYVAAWENRVVVFNPNGDVITELLDRRLSETQCVCVTEDDIVLVAGVSSQNVVMFDKDGNSLGELVSTKDMLFKPSSLCYDKERCRLLAGFISDKAQVFQLTG